MKKVILFGDSIRMGYEPFVREVLTGRAEVHAPEENCRFTQSLFVNLSWWKDLAGDPDTVDVVHWNCGHWDMARWRGDDQPLNTPEVYGEMLARIDEHLRLCFPNAIIVYALTTPVLSDGQPMANPRATEDVRVYNAVAKRVMQERGVPINDLFSLMESAPPSLYKDAVHFTEAGSRQLAGQVSAMIGGLL